MNGDEHGFAESQTLRFRDRFLIAAPTFNDATSLDGSGETSFDATVFVGRSGDAIGRIFIAFRGTGQNSPLESPNDLSALRDIGLLGAATSQIVAMYNWWQRVSTRPGVDVPQYRTQIGVDGVVRVEDAKSTGEVWQLLAAAPGSKISVTGSSLGGHLAMAFAGLFPDAIDQAVAFNSPGFVGTPAVVSLFATLGGMVPVANNPLITNVVSSEANNAGDQLNLIAGYPGDNFPGVKLIVPIENQFASDVQSWPPCQSHARIR